METLVQRVPTIFLLRKTSGLYQFIAFIDKCKLGIGPRPALNSRERGSKEITPSLTRWVFFVETFVSGDTWCAMVA